MKEKNIKFCEIKSSSSEKGAKDILHELNNLGAKRGQIIAIDAPRAFSFNAWWNEALTDDGDLRNYLYEEGINARGPWKDHYNYACEEAELKDAARIYSITSSYDRDALATYWFYGKDKQNQ